MQVSVFKNDITNEELIERAKIMDGMGMIPDKTFTKALLLRNKELEAALKTDVEA